MRRVLIVGEKSYIGNSFEMFTRGKYEISKVNSRNEAWRKISFKEYDTILHCVGIAHVSYDPRMKNLYYEVNCNLAAEVAKKAKSEGVKQFIYLSSILIYGNNQTAIEHKTKPSPDNFYGESKLKAEYELQKLSDNDFLVCIIRVPMVYGRGSKGNFKKLVDLAKIVPFFPDYPNKRSMIYIDNLCVFFCDIIDSNMHGIFLPQNNEYTNTTGLICYIAECYNRRIYTTKLFNPLMFFLMKYVSVFRKLFGNLYYIQNNKKNSMLDLYTSIKKSLDVTQ